MNNPTHTTRRAILTGALASTAALAAATLLPVSVAALTVAKLPDLIQAHKRAYRTFTAATRAYSDLADRARIPQARVYIGELLDSATNGRRPLAASTYDEIEAHAGRYVPSHVRDAWIDDKRTELRLALRRQRYAERKAGLPAQAARVRVASEAEHSARLDLVAFRPFAADEAKRKAAYMARAIAFREQWHHSESFVTDLIARINALG